MRTIKFRGKIEGNWWYVTPDDDAWEQFWAIVDRSTVGQFTGLLDKNSKEVYEGDIIKGKRSDYGKLVEETELVEYDESMVLQPFHHIADYDCNFWVDCLVGGFEIIGNRFEHPELLK